MNNLSDNQDNFIEFEIKKIKEDIVMINFILKRGLDPQDLKRISPPDPVKSGISTNIVVLSGRGPIWLYGFLIHFYHLVKAIAIFDPRYNAAIIVESHFKEYKIGDIIQVT